MPLALTMTDTMSWLDWMIIFIPLIIVVFMGCKVQHYVSSVSGFLAAGRKAGRYLLTVADGTAGMGLISVCAIFEMQYQTGFALGFWNNLVWAVGLIMTLTGFVTYRYRETRVLTMAQFFELRYSRGFRIFAGGLAFISGTINYALFPAVAGRFIIYYCGLPFTFSFLGLTFSTYGSLMALFLGIALFIVLTGGQLTTIVTDCCQGIYGYFAYSIVVIALLMTFSIVDVQEAILSRPVGMSFFNPFNVGKLSNFNLLYIFIGMFSAIYNRNAWLGNQGYLCSAANPHEQKMAGVLAQWRAGFQGLALMLLVIAAYTYMNSSSYKDRAQMVNDELDVMVAQEFAYTPDQVAYLEEKGAVTVDDTSELATAINSTNRHRNTIKNQMLVPVALRHILPMGVTGIFCALMIFLMVSTDTTYLHSWGTIFVQDLVLPIRNKPFQSKTQILLLRLAIFGIALFAWFFSFYFSQGDYILQFFAMTGTIFLGGAGACIIGGLYWKKGTAAGAYAAMTVGLFFAISGFLLDQKWTTLIYPMLHNAMPEALETFRQTLCNLGERLPFVNWEASPEQFMEKFPITSQEFYFLGMLSALTFYIVLSLLTCKKDYNLDKLLHRGEYNLEHFVAEGAKVETTAEKKGFDWKRVLLGFTPEYTKGDRALAWSVILWSTWSFLVFLTEATWNLPLKWRWQESKWFNVWRFYELPVSLLIGIATTIWFTLGGTRDLRRLFKALREDKEAANATANSKDDGMVRKEDMQ